MKNSGVWLAFLMPLAWAASQHWNLFNDLYVTLTVTSVVLCAAVAANRRLREEMGSWFKVRSAADVFLGVIAGGLLVLLTHLGLALGTALWPALSGHVAEIYGANGVTHPILQAPLVVVVVLSEEILWRAATPWLLAARLGKQNALLVSVVLYAVAQLGVGYPLVGAVALLFGSVWLLLRVKTESLVPPILAHLIWTVAILFAPIA